MLDTVFQSVFSDVSVTITPGKFILCVALSLVSGLITAFAYSFRRRCTRSFAVTLTLLPAVICVVIMLVNGNIGAGVAVAGAFSLVRFRSAPGTAQEIGAVFTAMAAGLACGMGYLGYGVLFAVIIGGIFMLLGAVGYGERRSQPEKSLRIVIPEDLDYTGVFDDIMEKYTDRCRLISAKTSDLGSLFKLSYDIKLKDPAQEKKFIDELRCRNGNLEIAVSDYDTKEHDLL